MGDSTVGDSVANEGVTIGRTPDCGALRVGQPVCVMNLRQQGGLQRIH